MRFYNSDGSIKSEDDDVNFGWTFNSAVEEDENNKSTSEDVASKQSFGEDIKNKKLKNAEKKDQKIKEAFCNSDGNVKSIDDVDTCSLAVEEEKVVKTKGDDDIDLKKSFGEGKQKDNTMENAGQKDRNAEVNAIDYSRYNLEMRYKEELTDFLLQLDNAESLLLLSIVNNGLYKILEDSQKTTIIKTPGLDLAIRLSRRERLQKLRNVFRKTPQKESSLLAELNQCDLVMDLEEYEGEGDYGGLNSSERREAFERIGLNGNIDKTLRDFFDKTCEVHVEVAKIGKCFREIDAKVADVIKKTSEFHRDVRETKFLNDVLNLLEGNFEKIRGTLPFRNVGKITSGAGEMNLIV